MKNADEMTADELESLAKQKREQENKPIKEGFLKCDLYEQNPYWRFQMPDSTQFANPEEIEEMLKDINESFFCRVLPKGTRFICYYNAGRQWNLWQNDTFQVVNVSDEFAEKFLENIKDI